MGMDAYVLSTDLDITRKDLEELDNWDYIAKEKAYYRNYRSLNNLITNLSLHKTGDYFKNGGFIRIKKKDIEFLDSYGDNSTEYQEFRKCVKKILKKGNKKAFYYADW